MRRGGLGPPLPRDGGSIDDGTGGTTLAAHLGTADGISASVDASDGVSPEEGPPVVKQEGDTPPSGPAGDPTPGDEMAGAALPVPDGADGDGRPPVEGNGRHDAGATGTDDGLPSFEDEEVGASPRGSDAGLPGGSPPGTPGPTLDDCDPPVAGVPVTDGLPHGAASPPATTVFGGGIGGEPADVDDDDGGAGVRHRVPLSDSDSDLGASSSANAGTAGTAAVQEGGAAPSPPGSGGALQ